MNEKSYHLQLKNCQKEIYEASLGSIYGKSYDDLITYCAKRGGPSESTIRHEVPKMVKMGVLRVVSKNGTKPLLFKPSEEIPCKQDEATDFHGPKEELDSKELAEHAKRRALEIIDHINRDESWRKSRRIKSICRKEISPFIASVLYLKGVGYKVPGPWDFNEFWDKHSGVFWEGIAGARDLSGPIRICRDAIAYQEGKERIVVDSTGKDVVNPNLLEWRSYLYKVVKGLESGRQSHKKKTTNKIPSDGNTAYVECRPERFVIAEFTTHQKVEDIKDNQPPKNASL